MLNIHQLQSGYELFTTLCIVGDSDLAGIYVHSTPSRGSYCKKRVYSHCNQRQLGIGKWSIQCSLNFALDSNV